MSSESNSADPFAWIEKALAERTDAGLRRELRIRQAARPDGTMTLDGRSLVNFSSNDYLGLAADPRLAEAATAASISDAWGAGASPLVTGRTARHAALEAALAEFEGSEAALLFTSGYSANVGTIPALVGRGDSVFSDAKNHASLIDGCRLSGAGVSIYRHADASDLHRLLAESPTTGRRLVVTDSVFSMDGDAAPLNEIAALAERFDAMLLVDEAHATGVFGSNGSGLCEELADAGKRIAKIGTLSKALGSHGGFLAGSAKLIDWVSNRARSYVFSTASPAALSAAGLTGLEISRQESWRRTRLLEIAARLRDSLREFGWDCGVGETQIVPIYVGEPQTAVALSAQLAERGLWVPASEGAKTSSPNPPPRATSSRN